MLTLCTLRRASTSVKFSTTVPLCVLDPNSPSLWQAQSLRRFVSPGPTVLVEPLLRLR